MKIIVSSFGTNIGTEARLVIDFNPSLPLLTNIPRSVKLIDVGA